MGKTRIKKFLKPVLKKAGSKLPAVAMTPSMDNRSSRMASVITSDRLWFSLSHLIDADPVRI